MVPNAPPGLRRLGATSTLHFESLHDAMASQSRLEVVHAGGCGCTVMCLREARAPVRCLTLSHDIPVGIESLRGTRLPSALVHLFAWLLVTWRTSTGCTLHRLERLNLSNCWLFDRDVCAYVSTLSGGGAPLRSPASPSLALEPLPVD